MLMKKDFPFPKRMGQMARISSSINFRFISELRNSAPPNTAMSFPGSFLILVTSSFTSPFLRINAVRGTWPSIQCPIRILPMELQLLLEVMFSYCSRGAQYRQRRITLLKRENAILIYYRTLVPGKS